MSVPRAVATGVTGADRPELSVQPRRVALVAAVLGAAFVVAYFAAVPVPGRVIALLGGAGDGLGRDGGERITLRPRAGEDVDALERQLRARDDGSIVRRDGDHVIVELPGVTRDQVDAVAQTVNGRGLELREVIESTAVAPLVDLGLASGERNAVPTAAMPIVDEDHWREEVSDELHTDLFVRGTSREQLVAVFATAARRGWEPPPHTIIAFERDASGDPDRPSPPTWRSYVVRDRVEIDGTGIAHASATSDPSIGRPLVLLEFTRPAARAFGELTARIVGHKVATIFGGDVISAPVINGPIRGGRASISMGGNDPAQQRRDTERLVQQLEAGRSRWSGELVAAEFVAGRSATREWLGRLVLALLAGLTIGVLTFGLVRYARPERRAIVTPRGPATRLGQLAITALCLVVAFVGTQLTLPGVNDAELMHVVSRAGTGSGFLTLVQVSVFALRLAPLLTAYVLVEIVAAIVPRWRRRRLGGFAARRRLGLAVAIVAIAVAAVQAWLVVSYLQRLTVTGAEIFDRGYSPALIILTLVAGTLCLAVLASIISNRGVGNGYMILTGAGIVLLIVDNLDAMTGASTPQLAVLATTVVAVALVVHSLTSWHIRALHSTPVSLPSSGLSPIGLGGGLAVFANQLAAMGVTAMAVVTEWLSVTEDGLLVSAVVVIVMTVGWSWVFARPGRLRAELARADVQPTVRRQWWRGVALTAGLLVALVAVTHLASAAAPPFASLLAPGFMALTIAVLLDLGTDLRARGARLVPIWPLHDPLLVDAVRDRLTAADIPHHIQSTRTRALLWLFGSYVPMTVWVPPANAAAADALLRAWFEPDEPQGAGGSTT